MSLAFLVGLWAVVLVPTAVREVRGRRDPIAELLAHKQRYVTASYRRRQQRRVAWVLVAALLVTGTLAVASPGKSTLVAPVFALNAGLLYLIAAVRVRPNVRRRLH